MTNIKAIIDVHNQAQDTVESLRQQLAVAAKTCAEMLSDQENTFKQQLAESQAMYSDLEAVYKHSVDNENNLTAQLAECQAREMIQMGALGVWDSLMAYQYTGTRPAMTALHHAFDKGAAALALPSDSTALDTLKKQWQREALVNIAVAVKEMGVFNYSIESIVEEIHNRAKELE